MSSRTSLQTTLEELIRSRNVYFQPPQSIRMRYPAIVYKLKNVDKLYADNDPYKFLTAYELILIDENPDTEFLKPILSLRYCSFDRFYVSDNLNHWVFTLYH